VADTIMAIQTGRLSLSRVTYHTNLQQAAGTIIPLGVIAEMIIGSWRALGLVARTSLTDRETALVGRLLRDQISVPFDFLKREYDWALTETKPGDALEKLAQRFSESLFFAPPTSTSVKNVLPTGDNVGAAVGELILPDLRKARDHEFYLMLAEDEQNGDDAVTSQDMLRRAA